MIILDLSELPDNETVNSFLNTMKEKGVMVIDKKGKENPNTRIITYEVDDEKEIQARVDERVMEKVEQRIRAFVEKFNTSLSNNHCVYNEVKRIVAELGYDIKV